MRKRSHRFPPHKGFFITFEGGEGAGKSTLIHHLEAFLCKKGASVLVTREPGGTPFGEEVRRVLLDKKGVSFGVRAELFLFFSITSGAY